MKRTRKAFEPIESFLYTLRPCVSMPQACNCSSQNLFLSERLFVYKKFRRDHFAFLARGRSEDIAAREGDIVRCAPGS